MATRIATLQKVRGSVAATPYNSPDNTRINASAPAIPRPIPANDNFAPSPITERSTSLLGPQAPCEFQFSSFDLKTGRKRRQKYRLFPASVPNRPKPRTRWAVAFVVEPDPKT